MGDGYVGGTYKDGGLVNGYDCGQLRIWSWKNSTLTLEKSQEWYTFSGGMTHASSVIASDVDADGWPEIITGGYVWNETGSWRFYINGQLRIWSWNGTVLNLETSREWLATNQTSIPPREGSSVTGVQVSSIFAADVDSDGKQEIVTGANAWGDSSQLAIWSWNGATLTLEKSLEWRSLAGVTRINSLFVADVDSDGKQELITVGYVRNGTLVYVYHVQFRVWSWNNSTLTLERSQECTNNTYLNSVFVADIDSDYMPEIITGGYAYENYSWKGQLMIWSTGTAISDFKPFFATNNVRLVYPSDSSSKPLGCGAAMVSDWLASMAVSTKLTNYTEGLDTSSAFVNQTSGRPVGLPSSGIVSFGGPFVNPLVKYAESNLALRANRAPVRFYYDSAKGAFTFQHLDGSSIPGASLPSSVINHGEDMFVVESYRDGAGRFILLCYGFGWKGTYAAGKYFQTVVYPHLGSFDANWVIVRWEDSNGDGFVNNPGDGDLYSVVASGRGTKGTVYVESAAAKLQLSSSWVEVSDVSSWSETAMKASSSSPNNGWLYGPYITSESNGTTMLGRSYIVRFMLRVSSNLSPSNVFYVDVCCNLGLVLASRSIKGSDFAASDSWQSFELSFTVPNTLTSGLEFRVMNKNHGITDVYVDQVQIRR